MIALTGERVKIQVSTLFFLFNWSCVLFQGITSQKSCAHFTLENYTTSTVEVTENTTVILMFYLKNKTCINMDNTVITIRRHDVTTNTYTPQCDIVLKKDTCRNTIREHIYCGCLNTFGAYTFSKLISKSDITQWKWTTRDGLADDVYVWFNEASTDRKFTSVTITDGRTDVFPVTKDVFSTTTEVFPVTTGLSSKGHLADEGISLVVTVALPVALIIIFVSIVIIICVKKTGQGKPETPCMIFHVSIDITTTITVCQTTAISNLQARIMQSDVSLLFRTSLTPSVSEAPSGGCVHSDIVHMRKYSDSMKFISHREFISKCKGVDALPDVDSFQDRQQGRIISFLGNVENV